MAIRTIISYYDVEMKMRQNFIFIEFKHEIEMYFFFKNR